MKRILLNVLTWISLLLLIATAVFWVRSYWWASGATFGTHHSFDVIWVQQGRLALQCQPQVTDSGLFFYFGQWAEARLEADEEPMTPTYQFAGFRYGHFFTSMAHDAWWVSIPCSWLVVLLALLPAKQIFGSRSRS
ncbi:MAG TPA: hypothetical protein VFE47_18290 [Tepidisphaeraceae bacterium]|jgi:hypothetical protein|nr:hypothetical protein [Tepidisphaeraceae bacterium]